MSAPLLMLGLTALVLVGGLVVVLTRIAVDCLVAFSAGEPLGLLVGIPTLAAALAAGVFVVDKLARGLAARISR